MEAWRDELYHYGVRGMKWKHKKGTGSALADVKRRQGINSLDSSSDRATARDTEWGSNHPSGLSGDDRLWIKKQNKIRARSETSAKAVERFRRPGMRTKGTPADIADEGVGLYRRGKVSGTTARRRSVRGNGLTSSGTYSGARSKRKAIVKRVKRVLS